MDLSTTKSISRRTALGIGVAALLAGPKRAEAALPSRWVDHRQLGPFLCRATFPLTPRETSQVGLAALESELRRVLSLRPCRESIEVLMLRSAEEHRALIAARHPEAPYRRALFVKQEGHATVYAYRQKELAVDLRHECTHALLHADLPMVPLWLDEGLAEYFEPPQAERPRGPFHLSAVRRDLRLGHFLRIAELEKKQHLAAMRGEDYRFAWAWVHFLLHGPARATEVLWGYLGRVRRSEPPGQMSALLAGQFPDLETKFVTHFRGWPKMLRGT